MRRVYLDQNKWIDLSRAMHGAEGGEPFMDALELLRYGTEARLVSLPLSGAHYIETWKRGDPESRQQLGTTMWELSRRDTMAGPEIATPSDIELACHLMFGRPIERPTVRVFGQGLGHAFGRPDLDFDPPAQLPAAKRAAVGAWAVAELERSAITGPPFELPAHGIARPDDTHGERYASGERHSAFLIDEEGRSSRLVARFVYATEFVDIWEPFNAILDRLGIPNGAILTDVDNATRFLESMPTRWVTAQLRRAGHASRDTRWSPNDLNDIAYLSVAAVHCDIVVTERKWAHHLRRVKPPVRATILTSLTDLVEHVVAA